MKIIVSVLAALIIAASAMAADVHLQWDPPDSGEPTGYKIYYGEASGAYAKAIEVGPVLTAVVTGLAPGKTYWFAATALYPDGESGYSNEVSKAILVLLPPTKVTITKTEQRLEAVITQTD